jgi:hypothetical protein
MILLLKWCDWWLNTCISRSRVYFCGQTQDPPWYIKKRMSMISFNFHGAFYGRSKALEVVKKLLQPCWSMWPNHGSVVAVSDPFGGFVVYYILCCFPKEFIKHITDTGESEFLITISSSSWEYLFSNWKYKGIKQMSSNSITSSTFTGKRSGLVLSLFLMIYKHFSITTLNRLTGPNLTKYSPFWRLIPYVNFMTFISSSRMSLHCQTEGSGSYAENLLGHNSQPSWLLVSGRSQVCVSLEVHGRPVDLSW